MRHAIAAAFLFAMPTIVVAAPPASAQSAGLEQACVNVAKNFLLSPKLTTGVVQSFPELDPPGARLTYATRDNPQPVDFTNQIECEFNKAEPPYGLTRFCISSTCYSSTEDEPEHRRRYLEVKALMDRQK
ncbi:hypothetical protein J2858_000341 [Neorhizobium galegae]|uniref:hypothetical protein n=1 Tax=Neorhizobium galegae TaxID=399 RepID=UPI001AE4A96A|nr:hypothetical protein [Neorhizobium galegae]MBP2547448.1 hypothetical protein [Neorhizobium galegae]